MRTLGAILLGSVAAIALIGGAEAADLPTKKTPPAPPPANCYASFMSWLDSTAADCPLTYMGVTVYGAIDVGGGYETNAARFNGAYPNGVQELVGKFSNGGKWQWVPNGLVQSNIGVKLREQIAPDWFLVGDVNAGFDPYSMQFANGPLSAAENNYNTLGNQTAWGDSSRTNGWDNSRAFLGINNTTLGTLTFGRQYAFTNDASVNYDPFGGAYAFSLIGTSGSVLAGTGYTETARYNDSIKYQVAYNGFRAGGLAQVGGLQQDNGAMAAYQVDLGGDFYGFSVDAIYAYARDAVKLSAYGALAGPPAGDPTDTLKANLADISAGVLAAKYKWNALTLFGGYEYSQLSNPTDAWALNAEAAKSYVDPLNGGFPGVIQANAYPNPEHLQVLWLGAKYGVLSNLDVAAGYYYEWQNNYSAAGTNCGPNTTPAITGATPQGAANSACSGNTEAVSGMIDWRPVKRLDVYAGVMYTKVAGGMANGFIQNNNTAFTTGLKLAF